MSGLIDLGAMKARLAELDAEREPLLALIRAAEAYEGVVGRTLFSTSNITVRERQTRDGGGGRSAPVMEATEAAVSEILDLFGPTPTGHLVELLADRPELNLHPKNGVNVLSARLSNSDRFQSRRGLGWWFVGRPWPDEDVEPEAESEMAD